MLYVFSPLLFSFSSCVCVPYNKMRKMEKTYKSNVDFPNNFHQSATSVLEAFSGPENWETAVSSGSSAGGCDTSSEPGAGFYIFSRSRTIIDRFLLQFTQNQLFPQFSQLFSFFTKILPHFYIKKIYNFYIKKLWFLCKLYTIFS